MTTHTHHLLTLLLLLLTKPAHTLRACIAADTLGFCRPKTACRNLGFVALPGRCRPAPRYACCVKDPPCTATVPTSEGPRAVAGICQDRMPCQRGGGLAFDDACPGAGKGVTCCVRLACRIAAQTGRCLPRWNCNRLGGRPVRRAPKVGFCPERSGCCLGAPLPVLPLPCTAGKRGGRCFTLGMCKAARGKSRKSPDCVGNDKFACCVGLPA